MYRILEYFEKDNGDCPVESFIDSLNKKVQNKVFSVFELVETFPMVPKKFFKKMSGTDDLWEIRVEYQSNIYRFLCFLTTGKLVILTNGFQKKSKKTPKSEIEIAENYKKTYLTRSRKK